MKVGLCDVRAVCVSSHINLLKAETVIMKLAMYIMAHELLSKAYFINPSHQSASIPLYFLGNGSVETLQSIEHTHKIEE
jgi:hypothetical protein